MTAVAFFLPGMVMPSALRYPVLFRELGDGVRLVAQELAVADVATRTGGYSMAREVDALDRGRRATGVERFHLYAHSGGGAVALAYVAAHPERLRSLALDEPSTDFSEEDINGTYWGRIRDLATLPFADRIPAFRRLQIAPGVDPAPLHDPRPAWMADGPERIRIFGDAVVRHRVSPESYRRFRGPVYYSYGGLTDPRYESIGDRLASLFGDFTVERYDGLHHLESSAQREPGRVADALRSLWSRS